MCHVPVATSTITNAHAIDTTYLLSFLFQRSPLSLMRRCAFPRPLVPPVQGFSFQGTRQCDTLSIYTATRFPWPLLGPFPLGQLYPSTVLIYCQYFFAIFFYFFFKKSCIPCAPMVTRFLGLFPYTLYILYRQVHFYTFSLFLYILYNTTHINVKVFCAKYRKNLQARKFPAIQASDKYKATFLYTMPGNSTFCTNQDGDLRHRHFHQKSGMVFV